MNFPSHFESLGTGVSKEFGIDRDSEREKHSQTLITHHELTLMHRELFFD